MHNLKNFATAAINQLIGSIIFKFEFSPRARLVVSCSVATSMDFKQLSDSLDADLFQSLKTEFLQIAEQCGDEIDNIADIFHEDSSTKRSADKSITMTSSKSETSSSSEANLTCALDQLTVEELGYLKKSLSAEISWLDSAISSREIFLSHRLKMGS